MKGWVVRKCHSEQVAIQTISQNTQPNSASEWAAWTNTFRIQFEYVSKRAQLPKQFIMMLIHWTHSNGHTQQETLYKSKCLFCWKEGWVGGGGGWMSQGVQRQVKRSPVTGIVRTTLCAYHRLLFDNFCFSHVPHCVKHSRQVKQDQTPPITNPTYSTDMFDKPIAEMWEFLFLFQHSDAKEETQNRNENWPCQ